MTTLTGSSLTSRLEFPASDGLVTQYPPQAATMRPHRCFEQVQIKQVKSMFNLLRTKFYPSHDSGLEPPTLFSRFRVWAVRITATRTWLIITQIISLSGFQLFDYAKVCWHLKPGLTGFQMALLSPSPNRFAVAGVPQRF